jgi:hypothetical protein
METKNKVPEVKVHQPLNPFMGKTFKVLTYNQVNQVIDTETVKIESQEELKTLLGEIKQYNSEYAYLSNSEKKYKKLITE